MDSKHQNEANIAQIMGVIYLHAPSLHIINFCFQLDDEIAV